MTQITDPNYVCTQSKSDPKPKTGRFCKTCPNATQRLGRNLRTGCFLAEQQHLWG